MTRVLIGRVVSLGLSLPSVAPGATLRQYLRSLSSDDEKVRFGAALTLAYAKQPNLAPTLASEIKQGFFAEFSIDDRTREQLRAQRYVD